MATSSRVIIVKGDEGPTGIPGLIWRGVWAFSTEYSKNDVVYYNGSSWVAGDNVSANVAPPTTPISPTVHPWELMSRGDNISITVSPTAPSGPSTGDIWIVTS